MTVKKAIEVLDWIINQKTKTNKEIYEPGILNAKYEIGATLYRTFLKMEETDIYNLEAVKEHLVPDCKHPKKMHDTCNGQKYCMNCNMDL